jgi:hypothetical protein
MALELPAPLPAYFAATNTHDTDGALATFAADASVRDEGQDMIGHDVIRAWIVETMRKYRFTIAPFGVEQTDGKTIVMARVSGTFPGSPIDLRYQFTIADGKIAKLAIK